MALVDLVRRNLIGEGVEIDGPYGTRKVTYADYTASGRALRFIEDYVDEHVLPLYGNSHTQTNKTGRQTSNFMEEARALIKDKTGCTKHDALVFVGSGCTAAANRLVQILGLSANWEIKEALQRSHPDMCRAVVFVGAYEHHSNLLPWRESLAEVVAIPEDPSTGKLDLVYLEEMLVKYADRTLRIGAFSAASNVTGIITDVDTVSILLHKHGALAVWDYACSGPYVEINMNARADGAHTLWSGAHKDAVFISPHKFVGGPQTPGILIFKKELSGRRDKCNLPGGGSVFYVTPTEHVYLRHCEEREEAGTPALVGAIRSGLAFQLKHRIGCETIKALDDKLCRRVLTWMSQHPNIHVLGSVRADRLPIISFMIHHEGMYLHYNYVCALLNDLFGIQVRGGCMCAGPYSQQILGIDAELAARFQRELEKKEDNEVIRPGYVRLSLHYTMEEHTVDRIIRAIDFVAKEGWRLLPLHTFCPRSGHWMHRHNKRPKRSWLHDIDYDALMDKEAKSKPRTIAASQEAAEVNAGTTGSSDLEISDETFAGYVLEATSQADVASSQYKYGSATVVAAYNILPEECEKLRWFMMPSEAIQLLQRRHNSKEQKANAATPWRAAFLARDYEAVVSGTPSIGWANAQSDSERPKSAESSCMEVAKAGSETQATESAVSRQPKASELDDDIAHFADQLAEESGSDSVGNPQETETRPKETGGATAEATEIMLNPAAAGGDVSALFKKLYDTAVRSVKEHEMIKEGDRVLVGLSGGKDSLTMLHILRRMQANSNPVKFELAAATVDPLADGFDPSPLIPYLEALGVPYFYERQNIIEQAKFREVEFSSGYQRETTNVDEDGNPPCASEERVLSSICAFCSRMKRGVLYGCARRNGYNVLALGQHLDDLAESFMMSVFHNGFLRTMKANYVVNDGDLRVVRPLIACREPECDDFADNAKLPVINMNCPACFDAPKERYRTKCLLASQEHLFPQLFQSLQRCMRPLMEQEVEQYLRDKDTELSLKSLKKGRKKKEKLLKRNEEQQRRADGDSAALRKQSPVNTGEIVEITSVDMYKSIVEEAHSKDVFLLIKFGAQWCPPCKEFAPVFAKLCKFNPCIMFASVDMDYDELLADFTEVDRLPTVKLYHAGALVDTIASPTEAAIRSAVGRARTNATAAAAVVAADGSDCGARA
eukprot:TRINITY_DN25830_c0_g3_i1.p1 TRINITY_DN25830_c0_g3~~TRINITY_DN25830_c0_g3_i1.p1  ORF type:complete len:1186 (+),score=196.42 TRINITY_DN25830_c0_g3_i1:29-3559(+)